ncbi:response regulator [Fontisphaera persica]|uniref:response regulator n=1 Tax=Fontisphaera persica TaxID=2974023 RepID=UPI0024BFFA2B|nr:response regulator [Fontisphaera persica]WCJ59795.1 response regulator [Fontisphaera persica]
MTAPCHQVLIVDDDLVLLELMGMILEQLAGGRWKVHTASQAQAALDFLQRHPMDLLVVDVCMPGAGGLALIREAHERYPHLLIAAISGDAPPGREEASLREGAALFLEKPRSGDGWQAIQAMLEERLRLAEETAPPRH